MIDGTMRASGERALQRRGARTEEALPLVTLKCASVNVGIQRWPSPDDCSSLAEIHFREFFFRVGFINTSRATGTLISMRDAQNVFSRSSIRFMPAAMTSEEG